MSQLTALNSNIPTPNARERALAHMSIGFLLDEVANGVGDLATLDALIVVAINQANIAPLTRDPEARRKYGRLDAPAPDSERRPVSISAVASSLRLPFETVRRRVRRLCDAGVCEEAGGGIIVPASFLASPTYVASVRAGHARLYAFYREVKAAGLLDELPAERFDPDEATPVRAAARLLADYVLRTTEHLMAEGGDVVSGLVLMKLLRAARQPWGGRALPVSVLAERLHIPAETVRRHANKLVERGQCVRTARGLALSDEQLSGAVWTGFMRDNSANVQRLFAALAERGVIAAWARSERP